MMNITRLILILTVTLCSTRGGIPISTDQISSGISMISSMVMNSLGDVIKRQSKSTKSTPMYDRKTPPPMLWIHLRKADPIIVNREFYNISNVPDDVALTANTTDIKIGKLGPKQETRKIQQMIPLSPSASFLEQKQKAVDPLMIQNGLYLTLPLRQPPQETINVASVEDTKTIQGFADYMRKKREIKRLNTAFRNLLREMNGP